MSAWSVWLTEEPSRVTDRPQLIGRYQGERAARRAAAGALGVRTLRGLTQAPTDEGTRYYGPGADDYQGPSAEVRS